MLQTRTGTIFDVKGLIHPPGRIVAFPRFILSSEGNRIKNGRSYKKIYSLETRYAFLRSTLPEYLVLDPYFGGVLCEVPVEDVELHYKPVEYSEELRQRNRFDELETDALSLVELLHLISNVSWNNIGISGSLLAKLHKPESDIDLIVYGESSCREVYTALQRADDTSQIEAYNKRALKNLYNFRSSDTKMSFADFFTVEKRKVLQGTFQEHDFYIRCVKDWDELDETYGDPTYRKLDYVKIEAVVADESEAIFTPCHYPLKDVKILQGQCEEPLQEVVSFRGRFCEQARKGETILAQGTVEQLKRSNRSKSHRLLLGNHSTDFMILKR